MLTRCLPSCATSRKSCSELPQPDSQDTGVPIPSQAVPVSKESCIFVSRNLLYRMAGGLPPLRMMGNILGLHWKSFTVRCILHRFVHSANTCEWLRQAGTLLGGGCSKQQKGYSLHPHGVYDISSRGPRLKPPGPLALPRTRRLSGRMSYSGSLRSSQAPNPVLPHWGPKGRGHGVHPRIAGDLCCGLLGASCSLLCVRLRNSAIRTSEECVNSSASSSFNKKKQMTLVYTQLCPSSRSLIHTTGSQKSLNKV